MQIQNTAAADQRFMAIAIRLARRGLGRTSPNPAVGAVVVSQDSAEIIARGWTQPGGRPHAEPHALDAAGARAAGATLYVTLEPCSHHGRTPPCVDAILAAGVKRVVCGVEDPDPRVAGRGLTRLREAGLDVVRGVLAEACHNVTLGHILRVTERRPFVQLKLALAPDGSVPRGGAGSPTWVTGPDARARGHLLRAQADAILVGRGTLHDDDPQLTCRLPGLAERSPVRIVLIGSTDRIPEQCALASSHNPPVWWVVARAASAQDQIQSTASAVIPVSAVGGRLWLPAVMEEIVARGVTRLLVEGGPTVWRAFDRAGLVDEVVMFLARDGSQTGEPKAALRRHVDRTDLRLIKHMRLESDDMFVFRR